MSGVATAIGVAGVGSAVIGSKAAKKAAKTQAKSADAGIAEQRRQFDALQQQQQPWIQAGTAALNRLQDPAAFTASPDYGFRRDEGTKNITNSFAARGGALSGNALKALTEFNSNLASGEYGNWWNRQAGLAGVGQAATNAVGSAGMNMANNVSNILGQQGDARASGIIGSANAIQGGIGDIASIYGYYKAGGFGGPKGTPPIWSGNYGYGNAPNVRVG
jgi:hypothetical protein